jgi:hypothetical protein
LCITPYRISLVLHLGGIEQVGLPVMWQAVDVMQPQPDRQCATYQEWRANVGVTTVGGPNLKSLPISVIAPCWSTRRNQTCVLELSALNKVLASQLSLSESLQASLLYKYNCFWLKYFFSDKLIYPGRTFILERHKQTKLSFEFKWQKQLTTVGPGKYSSLWIWLGKKRKFSQIYVDTCITL